MDREKSILTQSIEKSFLIDPLTTINAIYCDLLILKLFTRRNLRCNFFFNKVAGLRPATVFEKDPNTDVFL